MGEQGSCLDSSSDNSPVIRLVNSPDSSSDSSLVNSPTLDRVLKTTTTRVELRLSLTQQVGGTRRRVTGDANRKAKAIVQRQSRLSHSSPSGKMRRTSKYRQRKRPKMISTCTLTSANSTTYRFPHFSAPLIKSLMHYLLINNLL